jgi:DNA-binding HxlR family transcriptional regulator
MDRERMKTIAQEQAEAVICPVERTARLVGSKWSLLIIRDLIEGRRRFSELQKSLRGISPRTLSHRLSELAEEGLITRRIYAEVPPRVEYSLTEKGKALATVIEAMREYGAHWL